MEPASESTKSVVLKLSALPASGADVVFPERCITLSDNSDNITIGRASKVSTKGFVANADNTWFDSPVMSRMHARLCAKLDDEKVEIVDLGSLHGTFLNGDERIPAEERRELKDGDLLRFGAPIWHGTKQFVPTTVRVNFHFPHRNVPRSFKVPDGSDDGSDSSGTDEEMDYISRPDRGSRSPALNPPTSARVIDLTAAPASPKPEVIDLASPCSSEGKPGNNTDDFTRPNLEAAISHFASSGSGEHSHLTDVHPDHSHGLGARLSWPDVDQEFYEDDADSMGIETDQQSDIEYPDEETDGQGDSFDEGSSDQESDDISDMQGLESSEEGHTSGRDFDMDQPAVDGGWDEFPEVMPLVESLSRPSVVSAPPEAAHRSVNSCSIELLLNEDRPPLPDGPEADSQAPKPSPPATQRPSYLPPEITAARMLGARTGKMEFFMAREQNKSAVNAQKATTSRPMSSVHALCNADEPTKEPSHGLSLSGQQAVGAQAEEELPPPLFDLGPFSPFESTTAGRGGSTSPRREVNGMPTTDQKLKRKAENISETSPEQEQWAVKAAKAPSPAPGAEEEHPSQHLARDPEPEETMGVSEQSGTPERDQDSAPTAAAEVTERPAKKARMMRVAERLGYAALGGVTAGAMIVGTLIYTAPTFA